MSSEEKSENTNRRILAEKITTLEEAHKMIKQLQGKLKAQSYQFLAWHRKFKIQEDVIAHIVQERNDQLRSLSTKLIMFEAKLYRKQKEIGSLLAQREFLITKQQYVIKSMQSQLNKAGLKYTKDTLPDTTNDSDSAVIMDDEDSFMYYQSHTNDGVTVARSISDVIQQSNSNKIPTLRRSNSYLRRPETLETVYSVEEDGDTEDACTAFEEGSVKPPLVYTKERLHQLQRHGNVERLDVKHRKQEPATHVVAFNRVMSNHRSVTKPKDVKYKRINKAKSKSLEELRGRLRSWVEKSNRFSFSFDQT